MVLLIVLMFWSSLLSLTTRVGLTKVWQQLRSMENMVLSIKPALG